MIQVNPANEFYGRHARDQCYIAMARIAADNLELGKIPIVDCMVHRQIVDGTVGRFMEQPLLSDHLKYLVHVMAYEGDIFDRLTARAAVDRAAAVRDAGKISSRERFHKFVTDEQPINPEELQRYEHLFVNTSQNTPEVWAEQVIRYVS